MVTSSGRMMPSSSSRIAWSIALRGCGRVMSQTEIATRWPGASEGSKRETIDGVSESIEDGRERVISGGLVPGRHDRRPRSRERDIEAPRPIREPDSQRLGHWPITPVTLVGRPSSRPAYAVELIVLGRAHRRHQVSSGRVRSIGSIAYTRAVVEDGESQRQGVFITLEGPDGSGKSSLLQPMGAAISAMGCDVVTTREPGLTPLGEQVRRLVLDTEPRIDRTGRADALLFAASRAQHVEEVIRPALARGAVVVCDRYADSSLAYQGAGSGVPMDELRAVQRFATGGLAPDLTVLLDVPVEAGLGRKWPRSRASRPITTSPTTSGCGQPSWPSPRTSRRATRSWTRRRTPPRCPAAAVDAVGRLAGRLPCLGEPIDSVARMPR